MNHKSHEPFKIRERIVFFGFGMLLLFAFLFKDTWIGLSLYAVGVALLDALLTYGVKIKSSKYVVKERLLTEQKISPKNFDVYCKMITNVRLISMGLSGLIASMFLIVQYSFFQVFSLGYFVFTFGGVMYVRRFTKIKKPVLISFYELSPEEKRRLSEKSFFKEIIHSPKYSNFVCNINHKNRM